jgi:hypothetical protein
MKIVMEPPNRPALTRAKRRWADEDEAELNNVEGSYGSPPTWQV